MVSAEAAEDASILGQSMRRHSRSHAYEIGRLRAGDRDRNAHGKMWWTTVRAVHERSVDDFARDVLDRPEWEIYGIEKEK